MKKALSIAVCTLLAAVTFSGCYTGGPVNTTTTISAKGDVKTGLGVVTSIAGSASAADGQDGKGEAVFTAAAVLVDENGTILSCDLDVLDATINFSAAGAITSDLTAALSTKNELGDNYGMKQYSPIQKEWDEQADAFCTFSTGKTLNDVAAIALDEGGKTTDADLAAGCTMGITDFIKAVSEAVDNATARGASAGDRIYLGISATPSSSKDSADGADGTVSVAATFMAVSANSEGVFTSAYADGVEALINFNATGAVTSDLSTQFVSKYDLKEDYGMKQYSPIQKEWYEQADGLCGFMVGRTMEQVSSAVSDGYASDADLAATCTINMFAFLDAAAKAASQFPTV